MKQINILHISPNFNYSCGVSKHVFELLNNFKNNNKFNVYFITNGGNALPKLEKYDLNYTLIKISKGWKNVFYFPFNYISLKKFCKKNKIDIIHTHHRYPEFLSNLLKKQLNIKTITTAHSFVNGYNWISFKSDKIIAVSNSIKNFIIKNYKIPRDKIVSIYNCITGNIDLDNKGKDDIYKVINFKDNDLIILFAGRINRTKGTDVLVNAFRKIKNGYPNIQLVLIGDVLDNTLDDLSIQENEDILRLQSREDINNLYQHSNIIVLPARVEAIGYIMLEAGYFKKPFIGSRIGGIAEFLEDGVNGFLFEPGNADDLAEKIKFVIDNPEKAKSAAEKLHKKVKKYCNCEDYFAKLTSIYEDLVNSP